MNLQEAIKKAPKWATHISVSHYNNCPEFYNSFTGNSFKSLGVKRPNDEAVEIREPSLSSQLLAGEHDTWYLVKIKSPKLENK